MDVPHLTGSPLFDGCRWLSQQPRPRHVAVRDDAASLASRRKSAAQVSPLPLRVPRMDYFFSARSCILFLPWRAQELSLHAIADRVSAARPEPLLPAPPGRDTHHSARIRRHHRRARLAHALSRPGCRVLAANAFKTGCGANERTEPWVARGRGMDSMFGAFARMHVYTCA